MSTGFRGNRAGSYQQTTFPANRAVITNSEGRIDFSPVTSGEVGYLANARSNIQEQIDEISSDVENNSFNISSTPWVSESTLPYGFRAGSAAVCDGEIHIVGGAIDNRAHYKWDGASWTELSKFPYMCWFGSMVVYNNEIHMLGGGYGPTEHNKWNGTSWVSVSTLPYRLAQGSAVVYNNEIHILGSANESYTTGHYKWDGTSWTEVSTLPYPFFDGAAVVFNNEIHIMGSDNSSYYTAHYKWDGTSWSSVSTLPYGFDYAPSLVYGGELHILGGYGDSVYTNHYSYKATRWSNNSDSTTSTDYPYIYEIQRSLFTDDSKPIWQAVGIGDIPTSTETQEASKIACAYFDDTGITLYATEQPNCDLVLQVKGV